MGNAHRSITGNGVSLISKSERQGISELVTSNQFAFFVGINAEKWWLKDANTSTNRASFVDGKNVAADAGIKKTTISSNISTYPNGTCGTISTGETGVMPINSFRADAVMRTNYLKSAVMHINLSYSRIKASNYDGSVGQAKS